MSLQSWKRTRRCSLNLRSVVVLVLVVVPVFPGCWQHLPLLLSTLKTFAFTKERIKKNLLSLSLSIVTRLRCIYYTRTRARRSTPSEVLKRCVSDIKCFCPLCFGWFVVGALWSFFFFKNSSHRTDRRQTKKTKKREKKKTLIKERRTDDDICDENIDDAFSESHER